MLIEQLRLFARCPFTISSECDALHGDTVNTGDRALSRRKPRGERVCTPFLSAAAHLVGGVFQHLLRHALHGTSEQNS